MSSAQRIALDDRRAIAAAVDARLGAVSRALDDAIGKAESTRFNWLGRDESAQVRKAVQTIRGKLESMRNLGERIKGGEFSSSPKLATEKFNYLVRWAKDELGNLPGIGVDADAMGLTDAVFYTATETAKQTAQGVATVAGGVWDMRKLIVGGVALVAVAVIVLKVKG